MSRHRWRERELRQRKREEESAKSLLDIDCHENNFAATHSQSDMASGTALDIKCIADGLEGLEIRTPAHLAKQDPGTASQSCLVRARENVTQRGPSNAVSRLH